MIRANEVLHDPAVLELMPTAVYVIDRRGLIRAFNSKACEFWGQTPKILDSDHKFCGAFKLFLPDGTRMLHEQTPMVTALVTGASCKNAEVVIERVDGTRITVLVNISALRDEKGKIVGAINCFQDISEQVESRKNVETQKFLEKSMATLDTFISICSHELKTPLTSLKFQAQIALGRMKKGDESLLNRKQFIAMVERNDKQLDRLVRLVDDMLDVTRIQSGKLTMLLAKVDLVACVKNVIGGLTDRMHGNPDLITVKAEEAVLANLDSNRIEQVITNLATNAIKYGDGKPVEVEIQKRNNLVRLKFRDSGRGIALKGQGRIFERFERAEIRNDTGGLGLGLYISKQIVEAHSGRIYVESRLGKGSTFIVELPMKLALTAS